MKQKPPPEKSVVKVADNVVVSDNLTERFNSLARRLVRVSRKQLQAKQARYEKDRENK